MAKYKSIDKTRKITYMAILTALVFTLQAIAPLFPVSANSLALGIVPIIVGAAMYGPFCGMWLGLVFAGATLSLDLQKISPFLNENWFFAVITIIFKMVFAGAVCGLVYKLIAKENEIVAAIVASIVAPLVNTSMYIVCCLLFFFDYVEGFAILGVATLPNVIVEFLMCPILAPALIRVALAFKRLK